MDGWMDGWMSACMESVYLARTSVCFLNVESGRDGKGRAGSDVVMPWDDSGRTGSREGRAAMVFVSQSVVGV